MTKPQRIVVIEIKTMDNPGLDSSQLATLTAFSNSNQIYLGSEIEPIKLAILDAIVHLGSNYRHPLLFNVQVLPGDKMDAYMSSIRHSKSGLRRRKRK